MRGADGGTNASSPTLAQSAGANARIGDLRTRFVLEHRHVDGAPRGASADANAKMRATRMPVLGVALATGFERSESGGLRAVLPTAAKRGVARLATVELPMHADGESQLEDAASRVSVRFRWHDAKASAVAVAGGYALYAGALDGADVIHRVHAEGPEDYVVFETRPAHQELLYEVDVSRVPGLRLVSNTLEFLDERGTPALRVAPPYVVDARSERHDAKLTVTGCEWKANAGAPSGKPVTKPGATHCTVRIAWNDVAYPAMVDPAWTTTGSMASARYSHTATLLPSGKVLIAGGSQNGFAISSAELFDPAANGGAGAFIATGAMTIERRNHRASVLPSGNVVVAGGVNLASAEVFDPTANGGVGAFVAAGAMATGRNDFVAVLLSSGKVLVAGGNVGGGNLASAELFDPAANGGVGAFIPTGSMATVRSNHAAILLSSGKVLVAGGSGGNAGAPLASAELFDSAANGGVGAFVPTGTMAAPHGAATLLPSGQVLVAGGSGASAELFDPTANGGLGAFAATSPMAIARANHTLSTLGTGIVVVAGGSGSKTAELFDPAAKGGAGAFTAGGSTATARISHTATVLASGKVLLAGGTGGGVSLASAELFAQLGVASVCTGAWDCLSGICEDGVCCASACGAGGCDRCDLPGSEGTCTIVPQGGVGANVSCGPFYCDGASGVCPTSCTSDAACTPDHYCATNATCQLRKAQATACNTVADCKVAGCRECTSGNCVDGFCCNTACAAGSCDRCDLPASVGTCTIAPEGNAGANPACALPFACDGASTTCPASCNSDAACAPAYYCAPNGTCLARKAQAATCNTVADCKVAGCRECTTGNCVDGVCCDEACAGLGEGCTAALKQSGADGTCGAVKDGVDPCASDDQCADAYYCAADGTCRSRKAQAAACNVVADCKGAGCRECASGNCVDGVCCDATCTGLCQVCAGALKQSGGDGTCGPTKNGTDPRNECNGLVCNGTGACVPRTATCNGDHTTTGADGQTQDCTPYRCDSTGACRDTCTTVADCVAPALCDTNGKCALPTPDSGSDGGCGVIRTKARRDPLALSLFVLLALAARRRRAVGKSSA
jgi:hypothetical protein